MSLFFRPYQYLEIADHTVLDIYVWDWYTRTMNTYTFVVLMILSILLVVKMSKRRRVERIAAMTRRLNEADGWGGRLRIETIGRPNPTPEERAAWLREASAYMRDN